MVQKYTSEPKTDYQLLMRGDNDFLYNHEITNHTDKTIDIISKVPDSGNIRSLKKEYWNVRKFNKAFQRMNSKKPSTQLILVIEIIFIIKKIEFQLLESQREYKDLKIPLDSWVQKAVNTDK